jgi:hypothetical protein
VKRITVVNVPIERNVPREVLLDGKTLRGALGPFDFPERLRIGLSDDGKMACVDLLYAVAPDEKAEPRQGPNGMTFNIGKESGRILQMRFPMPDSPAGELRFKLEVMAKEPLIELGKSAERLPSSERPARRLAHYSMFPDLLPLVGEKLAKLRTEPSTTELR